MHSKIFLQNQPRPLKASLDKRNKTPRENSCGDIKATVLLLPCMSLSGTQVQIIDVTPHLPLPCCSDPILTLVFSGTVPSTLAATIHLDSNT